MTRSLVAPGSHTYRAFGLSIHSEIELPELASSSASYEDVSIRRGSFEHDQWRPGEDDDYRVFGPGAIAFPHATGWYELRDAAGITLDEVSGSDPALTRLMLLGRAMGALVQWRGLLALHASAVATPQGAVIILGSSGSGKSTTAAAFLEAGYSILSDEVVAVDFSTGIPLVLPGYATLRLWPAALDLVNVTAFSAGRLPSPLPKIMLSVSARAHRQPEPVRAICALNSAEESASTEWLDTQSSLKVLLGNSYAPRLIGVTKTAALHLTQCSKLASARVLRVPVDKNSSGPMEIVGLIEREAALTRRVHGGD